MERDPVFLRDEFERYFDERLAQLQEEAIEDNTVWPALSQVNELRACYLQATTSLSQYQRISFTITSSGECQVVFEDARRRVTINIGTRVHLIRVSDLRAPGFTESFSILGDNILALLKPYIKGVIPSRVK